MGEIVIVTKIGTGKEDDPFRPDTDAVWWELVEERETEFVIRIKS